ncbi:hypothetical protein HN031_18190 [Nocardioides sp. zg-1308]|uniref:AMIN-like domain-containing (lipo)protein n=1 Tax=Nocardioides sp. zg-1308 TaxID=2736253 RepID=UPI0015549347|nr:hypothetical protein [Nocardioides sp. zg-1308]NPD06609.1 hypothetical protein [Nocardioides sp. zg-1308]
MTPRLRAALSATLGALLLTACGTGAGHGSAASSAGGPPTGPADERSTSPSTAPEGPPFGPPGDAQDARPSGEWDLQLEDVRLGDHDGFDRVVLEFSGTGTPGWGVNHVERARAEGSGEAVALGGDRVLNVSASGTGLPEEGSFEVPRRLGPAGDIADVHVIGWFEGYTQVLVGLEGDERPFRVFGLADPPRLVVDVLDVSD